MAADRGSDHRRLKTTPATRSTTATAAVVVVAAVVAAMAVTATRATTFEGGETATVPPDDTVYMTEEVAAWNATAAAAGDYVYDDYDSSTADVLQVPGGHHYSPKPVKPVARVGASTAVPAATITVQIHSATVTEVPVTSSASTAATVVTTAATAATTAATAAMTAATAATIAATTATTAATAATAADNATVVDSTAITATTESGVLMQIASPPGYESTTTVSTTTPTPTTIPNSSAPLLHFRSWIPTLLLSLVLTATIAP